MRRYSILVIIILLATVTSGLVSISCNSSKSGAITSSTNSNQTSSKPTEFTSVKYNFTIESRYIEELDENYILWQSHNIKNYDYTFEELNAWGVYGPTRICVRDGFVDSVVFLGENEAAPSGWWRKYTINYLFDELFKICRGEYFDGIPLYYFDITYDEYYGFPSYNHIDWERVIDEQYIIYINDFVVVD
ncbi:MAG: hypothetical protein JW856_05545 [Dehalococcoidales bacterium]|nr:hypothetical protein [Dehalococcoidales bacterium]